MPIKIPDRLPAAEVLSQENIFVMTESRALHQDIRPLRVLLLNLMPKKIETEIQLMRMLSNSLPCKCMWIYYASTIANPRIPPRRILIPSIRTSPR